MNKVGTQDNGTRADKRMLRNIVRGLLGIGLLFLLSVSIWTVTSYAQSPPVPLVVAPLEFGVTPPINEIRSAEGASQLRTIELIEIPLLRPTRPRAFNTGIKIVDPLVQGSLPLPKIATPTLTFEGISNNDNLRDLGFEVFPPSTNGAVGPNHYVQMVNLLFQVFDKSGNPLTNPSSIASLFAAAGITGSCAKGGQQGDPIVLYDSLADRWLLSQSAFNVDQIGNPIPPSTECIAISKTPDPTGAYFVYAFQIPNDLFGDFPKLAVWPDAYYMTTNDFDGSSFIGVGVFAFDRSKMLAGDPTANMIFIDLSQDSSTRNLFQMLPSNMGGQAPPAGTPNFVAGLVAPEITGDPSDGIRLFEFHPDFKTPSNTTLIERAESPILTAPFNANLCNFSPDCIAQPNTKQKIDASPSSRGLNYSLEYWNFGTHESLVTTHTVDVGSNRAGIRYYEIRRNLPSGSFFINEQGTFAPNDGNNRWMGSASMDKDGNIAVGYSVSSGSTFPSIRCAGRLANDPSGQLAQGETTLQAGSGSQSGTNRWGDYSGLVVDPSDGCTFWYTNEYYTSQNSGSILWQTRIGRFSFPACTANTGSCVGTGPFSIKGNVKSQISGVTLKLTVPGGCTSTTVTSTLGAYSFQNLASGSYTVTPNKTGCSFIPSSKAVTISDKSKKVNFTGTCL